MADKKTDKAAIPPKTKGLFNVLMDREKQPRTPRHLAEGELPDLPPQPGGFKTDPKQLGLDPLTATMLFRYLQQAPELRSHLTSVQKGSSPDTLDWQDQIFRVPKDRVIDFPPAIAGYTNNVGGDRVTLNPNLPDGYTKFVLGHELAHVAGKEHADLVLQNIEESIDPDWAASARMHRAVLGGK